MLKQEQSIPGSSQKLKGAIREALNGFIQDNTIIVRSPGRINLIGEHTDYNEGYVLPAAIDKAAYVALTPRSDGEIHLYAVDLNEKYTVRADNLGRSNESWPNYLLGVADQFAKRGYLLNGFDVALTSDVPVGSGLSSSAAVECAMAGALNELTGAQLDKLSLAKLAQKAEHQYAGVQCGIMDQFASVFGKKNSLIRLDCRDYQYTYIPAQLADYTILLLDTNVKHSLAASAYNERREECSKGVDIIRQHLPEVSSLRDVTISMLDQWVLPLDRTAYNRCRYVVEENDRLLRGCVLLNENNIEAFGRLMFETHEGLSQQFDVSCKELDFLIQQVKEKKDVAGARMMGGGFGGCTINLVRKEKAAELAEQLRQQYEEHMRRKLSVYEVKIEDGMQSL